MGTHSIYLYLVVLSGVCLYTWAKQKLTDDEIKQRIDSFMEEVQSCYDVPGVNLAVVKDAKPFYSNGYGFTDKTQSVPVTNKTMFVVASNTKAFVGVLLAKLLEQNKSVTWETPVRDVLGDWFYFKDAYRSQHANLRDMLSHRTGFTRNDPIRAYGFSMRQFLERLRFFDELYDFRTKYKYGNLMYGVAQNVAETIGGESWEDMTQKQLFQPIGMTSSTFVHKSRDRWSEFATPHLVDNDATLRPVSLEAHTAFYSTIGSPGSISSNAEDMTKWLAFHLNEGKNIDGLQVVNATALQETYNALMATGTTGIFKPDYPVIQAYTQYAYGWKLGYYRGYQSVLHSGTALGFNTVSTMLKDMGMGVYMTTNADSNLRDIVPMYILDLLLGLEPWFNATSACSELYDEAKRNQNVSDDNLESDIPNPSSGQTIKSTNSHIIYQNAKDYVGVYGHFGYGNISVYVNQTSGDLMMSYGPVSKWILQDTGLDNVFDGRALEPLWYWTLSAVTFTKSNGTIFDTLDVPFDTRIPSTFKRDLKYASAPPPPELCPN